MEFLKFEEIEDTLKQLNYTDIKKSNELNVYEAVNINGQKVVLQVVPQANKEGKNDYRIINTEILKSIMQKEDFQTIDFEFLSDDGTYKIYVNDYSKGHDLDSYSTPSTPTEEIDVSYKFL